MFTDEQAAETQSDKIGLALSGGGFRASIFHLGVIRRLEELGIMKRVAVISSVSGGSIIAAHYIVEMERRLRERREDILQAPETLDAVRLSLFEDIAEDFFAALDHNLRTRALIFSPFYHPLKWIKSLLPGFSRSDLIQAEYDRWFYEGNSLGQLPAVLQDEAEDAPAATAGPKLVLNTTSLMTGERVKFSRVPISGINELKKVNKNVLKLSKIVGASACVPGLFPPVPVSGDMLVDGGVSDNQGIEGLLENDCNLLLVSDASGQMEQVHVQSSRTVPVVGRTMSILQFQVRNKLLKLLQVWKSKAPGRQFAFIHTHLSLKDRPNAPRVPSEYVLGIARIRTDLDQFSYIEREALMYHGYTLIDSQIKEYCPELYGHTIDVKMKKPPLFIDPPSSGAEEAQEDHETPFSSRRKRIKHVLESGSIGMFLLRARRNYPIKASVILLLTLVIPVIAIYLLEVREHIGWLTQRIMKPVLNWAESAIPALIRWAFGNGKIDFLHWPISAEGVTTILALAVLIYLLAFLTYLVMRRFVRHWSRAEYWHLTDGKEPSTRW